MLILWKCFKRRAKNTSRRHLSGRNQKRKICQIRTRERSDKNGQLLKYLVQKKTDKPKERNTENASNENTTQKEKTQKDKKARSEGF